MPQYIVLRQEQYLYTGQPVTNERQSTSKDPFPDGQRLHGMVISGMAWRISHLRSLEAESIHIFREVAAEFQRPVMLYSVGKDSSVMLRLAQKAFYPAPIPFPLLHVDTTYKFREMIEFRDQQAASLGLNLMVHSNTTALKAGANPLKLGTERCCGFLKTQSLLEGLRA